MLSIWRWAYSTRWICNEWDVTTNLHQTAWEGFGA